MNIHLDRLAPIPLGEQIAAQIRLQIRRGYLAPGERLPTIRELAAKLEINVNTVAGAYRDLERDGVLVANRRAGTRVADRPPAASAAEALAARIGSELGGRLADLGLPLDVALSALAAAAQRPGDEPLRAAVLGRTPLEAEAAARRTAAILGASWVCVPVTPQTYRSSDFHLSVVDPALVPLVVGRPNRIGAFAESSYGPDFPAAAD